MPIETGDFEDLADGILEDLKSSGGQFWDQLDEDQIPILEQATKDLAKTSLLLITDSANAEIHKETILFIKSTITSETALTAMRAEERLRNAVESALLKLLNFGIALL